MIASLGLSLLGAFLLYLTARLPFGPGDNLADLAVPLLALACGVMAARLAIRKGSTPRRGRAALVIAAWIGVLVGVVATLVLLLIFMLCGAYWARATC